MGKKTKRLRIDARPRTSSVVEIDARLPKYRNLRESAGKQNGIPSANGAATKFISALIFMFGICTLLGGLGVKYFFVFFVIYSSIAALSLLLRLLAVATCARIRNPEIGSGIVNIAPIYTILIAIYKEETIIPALVSNLSKINWPKDRLDIIYLCESDDIATQNAVRQFANPSNSRLVIVPNGIPKTKPRALNYGLNLARGRFLTIYDAEDCPHPNQLREAFDCFASNSADVGMVQAPLITHNEKESFIAGQFALDYAIWFQILLPFFARFFGFIPLGGTSNHFRVSVLRRAGGWDAYNLTEDADLGIRLARLGYKAKTISSPTYEESPPKIYQWVRQRTRWIQGHLQTIATHSLASKTSFNRLKYSHFLGAFFTIFLGPLFIFIRIPLLVVCAIQKPVFEMAEYILIYGLALEILICAAAIIKDGRNHLWRCIITMPCYWILQTIAYLRASIRCFTHPFIWEKTAHGANARQSIKINRKPIIGNYRLVIDSNS